MRHYSSLASLKDEIKRRWPNEMLLFRGEARAFPRTTPGSRRMIEDQTMSFHERTFLLDAAGAFQDFAEETYPDTDPDEIEMVLQHYGLPNDLVDFSSSFDVAIFFACKDAPAEKGTLAVLRLDEARKRGLHLYDGRAMGLWRPARQHGWAFRCRPGDPSDLKAPHRLLNDVIFWFSFDKPESHGLDYLLNILDAKGDVCADQMREWLRITQSSAWQESEDVSKRVNLSSRI